MFDVNNDADLMTAELECRAENLANARRRGVCTHGLRNFGGLLTEGLKGECLDCGKVATWDELDADAAEWL
jgi:hypothetical protein